ncbi:unnamed protein product [Bathycoccus prasinos]
MPHYRLKSCKLRTSAKLCCFSFASFVSLLLLNSVFKSIHTLSKSIQIDATFIETAMSANEIPLEKLPISSMRKAILHLAENFKKEEHCRTCNKVQQKISERSITANVLDKKGPCNFLIFGVGFDSIMWTAMNPGRTVFLEDDELWAERVRETAPFLEIYTVNYPVRKREFPQSLERFHKHKDCNPSGSTAGCFLMLDLPQKLLDMSWDIIMVDAPNGGGGDNPPTRQMSIFTAAILARRSNAEGLNSERVVVLSKELPSTHDILSPFKTWSNCSLENTKVNTKGSRIKLYHPMDSESLVKSKDMPAVGALYPKRFAERGYWWWKAQEISYALRPKLQTLKTLENMFGEKLGSMAVFQVRRTDKTHGCATVYGMYHTFIYRYNLQLNSFYRVSFKGKNSKIKCKQEASAPQLLEFMKALQNFKEDPKNIKIVTDDAQIHAEILKIPKNGHRFLNTEPAPRRIPDKELRGGIFKGRALKDALDILTMSFGNPLIFTYSSGFGALALQIKQVRDDFCSNWSSLDWGKREWPPIGTMGEGGENQYCSLLLKKTRDPGAAIVSLCTCESSESN